MTHASQSNSSDTLVSVIIPVHNRVVFLHQAIASVLEQTHPRVEAIVVDDGSEIDPGPVIYPFGPRVRLLRKRNGGLASARNHGIANAAGEYLLLLDDDDFLERSAIADLLSALATTPNAVWAAGRYQYVDERGRALREHRCQFESGDVYRRMIHNNLMGAPSVVLASTDVVRRLGGFDESPCYHMAEDYDLWLRLARHSPLAATQRKVSNYRLHGAQFTQTQRSRHGEAVLAVLRKHQLMSDAGYRDDFRQSIARKHLSLGDTLYLAGRSAEARTQWHIAAEARCVNPWRLRWRRMKSHLPAGLLGMLRCGAQWCREAMRSRTVLTTTKPREAHSA